MKKVYLVYHNNSSDFYPDSLEEIFSTKEKAQQYISKKIFSEEFYIRSEALDSALEE